MKIWLRRTHLILTLFSALVLLSVCISGVLLSFAKEAEQWLLGERWQVQSESQLLLQQQGLAELVRRLNKQLPQATPVNTILLEQHPDLAWQAILSDGHYANFNPYNGKLLATYRFEDSLYGFVMAWHRWLLYANGADKPLRPLVSCAALIFIVQLLLGLWMWLRPRKRLRRLRINFSAKPHSVLYQLHTVTGVLLVLPLSLIAFSGMSFYWEKATSSVLEGITQQVREKPVHPLASENAVNNTGEHLDTAYHQARKALSLGELYRIHLPVVATDPLKLRIKMPGESHPYSWAWADANSGVPLGYYDASQANLTTQLWNFRYRFHIGDFYGLTLRLVWLILALVPVFFLLSGLYLFYYRYSRNDKW
ncbi:MAG: PepSY domain-containing protein [Gammaproteobacteria bacterium]|nr:PepSY domain-containing protein [Gammaproteobacteria bacterium]